MNSHHTYYHPFSPSYSHPPPPFPPPQVKIQDGTFDDGAAALEPTLSWSTATKQGDVSYEFGLEADARPTADLASLPKNFWGSAAKSFGGWGVKARAQVENGDLGTAAVTIDASNNKDDLTVAIEATAGADFSVNSLSATKGFDSGSAHVEVTPTYNIATKESNVVVGYTSGKSEITLTASKDDQEVSIAQQLDSDNKVTPTFSRSGKMSVAWEKSLGGDNSMTTTLTPNEDVEVVWTDANWEAKVGMPISGNSLGPANVQIKREVIF